MLTPSSNTALEPISNAMLAGLPEVSAYFARFRVTLGNYRAAGIDCVERHLGITVNYDFADVSEPVLDRMVMEVSEFRPDAITTLCTNLRAATSVARWESVTGIPVYDSIATVSWKSLTLAGVDPARVKGWGAIFEDRHKDSDGS